MARIDDAITAAQSEVTAAKALPENTEEEKATKATKVAAAEAKLSTLTAQKQAIQDDISDAVRGRIPDAEKTAKENERKVLAQKLGVKLEGLDAELDRIEKERRGQQSEVSRLTSDLTTREQELATEKAEREKAQRIAETARDQLRSTLIENALTTELIKQGVIHGEEQSYLDGARNLTKRDGITVEVEIKDDGTLEIKGDVQGAKEAVEKTKETYAVMFGETVESPTETPRGKSGGGGGKKPVYNPPLAVTGPRTGQ